MTAGVEGSVDPEEAARDSRRDRRPGVFGDGVPEAETTLRYGPPRAQLFGRPSGSTCSAHGALRPGAVATR